mmetsp:Transcript_8776/g.15092  ORF Transcript_8776/g.15092 Transcript_8776/m.15092 type:complete len:344 (+) Transcript_8776:67-1098(+)
MTARGVAPQQSQSMTHRQANTMSGGQRQRQNRRRQKEQCHQKCQKMRPHARAVDAKAQSVPMPETSGMPNSTFAARHGDCCQHAPEAEHAISTTGPDAVRPQILARDDESKLEHQTEEQSVRVAAGGTKAENSCDGIPEARKKTVVIFADYDGCFDIISPSHLPGSKIDKMLEYAKQIDRLLYPRSHAEKMLTKFLDQITADATRVTLFSGSNRQSRKLDESNAVQNDNGLARTGLKKLAEERKWHYESNLLEDAGQNPSSIMSTAGGSSEIKKLLVENNFKFLTGPTQVYFFDDVEKYLKYARVNATIPENIELKTVQFDWYGICIDGTQAGDHPLVPISCK